MDPGNTDVTARGDDDPRLAVITQQCPSRILLEQLADKWSLLVLGVLDEQPMRFNELRRAVDGISQRMLTRTLRRHEELGFLIRDVAVSGPLQVRYSLTPLGRSVREPVLALWDWTQAHGDEVRAAGAAFRARS